MKVFEALEHIKTNGPTNKCVGICAAVDDLIYHDSGVQAKWWQYRKDCMEPWVEYSGNSIYPVPSCMVDMTPNDAFNDVHDDDMWNPEHPYGAARLRLLDHCINWFKEKDL